MSCCISMGLAVCSLDILTRPLICFSSSSKRQRQVQLIAPPLKLAPLFLRLRLCTCLESRDKNGQRQKRGNCLCQRSRDLDVAVVDSQRQRLLLRTPASPSSPCIYLSRDMDLTWLLLNVTPLRLTAAQGDSRMLLRVEPG
jgi:hypothetical protein